MISCRRHSIKWLSYRGHLKEKKTKICPLVALIIFFLLFLTKLVLKAKKQRPDNCMLATTTYSQNFTTATSPKQQRSLKRAYRLPKLLTTSWTFKLILKFIQGQNRAWSKLLIKGAVSRNSLKFKQWELPPNWVELKNNNSKCSNKE